MLLIFIPQNRKTQFGLHPCQKDKSFFGQTADFSLLGIRGNGIKIFMKKGEKYPFRLHRGQKEKFLKIIPFKSQFADQRIVKK